MKWFVVAVALQCALLSRAEERLIGADDLVPDEPLVRCKRPLCEQKFCSLGFQIDSNGCEICMCLDDPCEDRVCRELEMCVPGECTGRPCHELPASCQPLKICPVQACYMECPFGLKKDVNDCDICKCKLNPCEGEICDPGQKCISHEDCEEDECQAKPVCVPDDHRDVKLSDNCPDEMCMMACEYGFKRDYRGCEICECSRDACEYHMCPEGETCEVREIHCGHHDPCPVEKYCAVKPLCQRQKEMIGILDEEELPRTPTCDGQGNFLPKQCEEDCWCVDDRGVPIEDTQQPGQVACKKNQTSSIDVSFKMKHNLPNVRDHLDNLRRESMKHLTEWMRVEDDYILELNIRPDGLVDAVLVEFTVIRGEEYEIDIVSAVYHLQFQIQRERCQMDYRGQTFQAAPNTVQVKHHFEPELPSNGGLKHKTDQGFWTSCYNNSAARLAGGIGACVILIVALALVAKFCCARKRLISQRAPKDTYKENLAFSNDLYSVAQLGTVKVPLPECEEALGSKEPLPECSEA